MKVAFDRIDKHLPILRPQARKHDGVWMRIERVSKDRPSRFPRRLSMPSNDFKQHCSSTGLGNGPVLWHSAGGQTLVAHLESYPQEQLLRVRKQGGGTLLLAALKPRELALARISADGLRVVATAKLTATGL